MSLLKLFVNWYWSKRTKSLKNVHWTTMDILTAGIKKDSEEAHEIVQLTEWIEQTLPMCIEQLELQMAARNSFPNSSEARRDFLMNYIWKRTSPLHKNYIDRYGHNYLYYDFAHSVRPSIRRRGFDA